MLQNTTCGSFRLLCQGLPRLIRIGRSKEEAHIVLDRAEVPGLISARHAEIVVDENRMVKLQDTGSTNGTWMRKRPCAADNDLGVPSAGWFRLSKHVWYKLENGDEIGFGGKECVGGPGKIAHPNPFVFKFKDFHTLQETLEPCQALEDSEGCQPAAPLTTVTNLALQSPPTHPPHTLPPLCADQHHLISQPIAQPNTLPHLQHSNCLASSVNHAVEPQAARCNAASSCIHSNPNVSTAPAVLLCHKSDLQLAMDTSQPSSTTTSQQLTPASMCMLGNQGLAANPPESHASQVPPSSSSTDQPPFPLLPTPAYAALNPLDAPSSDARCLATAVEEFAKNLMCPICHDLLAAAHVMGCSHAICGVCLLKWLQQKPSCPVCRSPLTGLPVRCLNLDHAASDVAARSTEMAASWEARNDEGDRLQDQFYQILIATLGRDQAGGRGSVPLHQYSSGPSAANRAGGGRVLRNRQAAGTSPASTSEATGSENRMERRHPWQAAHTIGLTDKSHPQQTVGAAVAAATAGSARRSAGTGRSRGRGRQVEISRGETAQHSISSRAQGRGKLRGVRKRAQSRTAVLTIPHAQPARVAHAELLPTQIGFWSST